MSFFMFYRASTTTSLGLSFFEVLFGKNIRTPIDTSLINDLHTAPNIDAYVQQILPKIELTKQIARENTDLCHDCTQFLLQQRFSVSDVRRRSKSIDARPGDEKGALKS